MLEVTYRLNLNCYRENASPVRDGENRGNVSPVWEVGKFRDAAEHDLVERWLGMPGRGIRVLAASVQKTPPNEAEAPDSSFSKPGSTQKSVPYSLFPPYP